MKRRHIIVFILVMSLVVIAILLFKPSPHAPWTETGHLAILVRAVPQPTDDTVVGLGIDNVELYKKDGGIERVSVLTRRVLLDPNTSDLTLLLDTNTPVSEYVGFGFSIKSPELRNA